MLDNYECDVNGVVFQVKRDTYIYDEGYINKAYNSYPILADHMSHLRLGYIIGAIGRVPESVLDVGYGNASFLSVASNVVKECYGYDVPPAYPLPDGLHAVPTIYNKHYDVVTFFDSLEHFNNIYEIKNIDCNFVVVSVPWCHYFSDEWFSSWKHRKPNEHLWHFNKKSLVSFFESIDFDLVSFSAVEDVIRKGGDAHSNILTAVFCARAT